MITPSGRFQVNTRLCLSISDFHPDTWNPSWTVSTIIMGLISFMNGEYKFKLIFFLNEYSSISETAPTLGSINSSDSDRRALARRSIQFNLANKEFVDIFPELAESLRAEAEAERKSRTRGKSEMEELNSKKSRYEFVKLIPELISK